MKTTISLSNRKGEVEGYFLFENEKLPEELKRFEKLKEKEKFKAGEGEIFSFRDEKQNIMIYGLGKRDEFYLDLIRRGTGAFYFYSSEKKADNLSINLPEKIDKKNVILAIGEAAALCGYKFDMFKSKKDEEGKNEIKEIYVNCEKEYEETLNEGIIKGEAQNYSSSIADLPANIINPEEFAKKAKELAKEKKLKITVFEEKDLMKHKMNGIIAVGQGSINRPKMVILEYNADKNFPLYAVVGKGVTFDSGGISIKPSRGMEEMKYDKTGACIALGVIKAVSELKLPIKLIAITPLVENLPSGTAQRPGDIIKMYNGKTVEVLNTDAEGRLILGDALAYACEKKPILVIDLATLTGAVSICLGRHAIGMLTNNEKFSKIVEDAGRLEHERVWQLPLWKEYQDMVKSTVADIKNSASETGEGSTITASAFLKEFVGETPWVHLDIAGVDQAKGHPYLGNRGSCMGARLVIESLKRFSKS